MDLDDFTRQRATGCCLSRLTKTILTITIFAFLFRADCPPPIKHNNISSGSAYERYANEKVAGNNIALSSTTLAVYWDCIYWSFCNFSRRHREYLVGNHG